PPRPARFSRALTSSSNLRQIGLDNGRLVSFRKARRSSGPFPFFWKPSHKCPRRRQGGKPKANGTKQREDVEVEAAGLWAAHCVARRSESTAAILPPRALSATQISGRAIRAHL